MPADTRSSRKAMHDDDSLSPSSTRKSQWLRSGNNQAYISSPSRSSERAKSTPHSGQSEKSSSLMDTTHSNHKRKRSDNELGIEANQVGQRGKPESNSITQRMGILTSHCYRDLFKSRKEEAKASDSVKGGRLGPCSSSNSGGSTKTIPVEDSHLKDGTFETNVQTDEAIKRQKKMGNTNGNSRSPRVCKDVGKEPGLFSTSPRNGPQLSPESGCETASSLKSRTAISSELQEQQKSFHQVLKPEMAKLYQTLGLKEDVQKIAEQFLVYMITNHRVIREPDTDLQAFQISVCWIAASITSEELDHVESLSLAREHLKFNCGNDEAEYAFSKMLFSRKMFLRSEGAYLLASSENQVLGTRGLASEAMNGNVRESTVCMQQKEKVAEGLVIQEGLDEQVLAPIQPMKRTEEVKKYAKKIKKSCEKEVTSRIKKHTRDVEEDKESFQKKRSKRENKYKQAYNIICKINNSEADKSEKLEILVAKHRQKLDQLESELATTLKDKEARHLADLKEVVEEADHKMERYASCIKSGLSDHLQSKEAYKECGVEMVPVNSPSLSGNDLKEGNASVPGSAAVSVDRERVITDNDATSDSPPTEIQINHEATKSANIAAERTAPDNLGVQGIHVLSADAQVLLPQTLEPHNDAENSGSAEVAAVSVDRERVITDNDATSNSPPTATQTNHEATKSANIVAERTAPDNLGVQGIHVSSAVTIDEVEQTATSKNDQPSAENPYLQTEADANEDGTAASERYTASRTEQFDETSSSTHNESTDSPSTMKPSVAQPITNKHQVDSVPASQEHEISGARLTQSNNQHVCVETSGIQNTIIRDMMPSSDHSVGVPCNASDQAVRSLPHEQAVVPLHKTASHPGNQLLGSSLPCQTAEARIQEDQRPLNRSIEVTPRRPSSVVSCNPSLHNSSQLGNYMDIRSLPATLSASGKEFDPLQREYERISGELNQVSKTHGDMASRLKLECDKEIEEIAAQIRRKYYYMLQEAEASLLPKKNELEHNQRKVVMNIALAEAFRSKCMSIQTQQVAVPSNWTQQLLRSQFTRRSGSPPTICPQTASAPPTQNVHHSTVHPLNMPGTLLHRSGLASFGNRVVGSDVRLPPPIFNPSMPVTSTSVRPQTANEPLTQNVNHSTVHPLTMPGTLLHRSGLASSSVNRVVASDVRLPPPIFNPSTPTTSTSVRALATMSQPLNGTSLRSQQPPPPPTHPTGAHGRPHLAETSARPLPLLQSSGSAATVPPLPEITWNFEAWNLSEFETSHDARQPDPGQVGGGATGVVCLSDDE